MFKPSHTHCCNTSGKLNFIYATTVVPYKRLARRKSSVCMRERISFRSTKKKGGLLSGQLFKDSEKGHLFQVQFLLLMLYLSHKGVWWLQLHRDPGRDHTWILMSSWSCTHSHRCGSARKPLGFIFILPVSPTQSIDGSCKIDIFSSRCESLWVMIDFDMSLRDDSTRLSKSFPGHVYVILDFLMMNDEAYRKIKLIYSSS